MLNWQSQNTSALNPNQDPSADKVGIWQLILLDPVVSWSCSRPSQWQGLAAWKMAGHTMWLSTMLKWSDALVCVHPWTIYIALRCHLILSMNRLSPTITLDPNGPRQNQMVDPKMSSPLCPHQGWFLLQPHVPWIRWWLWSIHHHHLLVHQAPISGTVHLMCQSNQSQLQEMKS